MNNTPPHLSPQIRMLLLLFLAPSILGTRPVLQPALCKMHPVLLPRCAKIVADCLGPVELMRLIFDHMGNAPDVAALGEVLHFNEDDILKVLKYSESAYISFGRNFRLNERCKQVVAVLGSVTWKFLNAHPLYRFLPRLHRDRFDELFFPGPDVAITRLDDMFTFPVMPAREPPLVDSRLPPPPKLARARSAHYDYEEYAMVGRVVFSRDYGEELRLYVDIRTGKSLYYSERDHGAMYWLPEQRLVVTRKEGGLVEVTHAEADTPLMMSCYFDSLGFDGSCIWSVNEKGVVIKQGTDTHGYAGGVKECDAEEMHAALAERFPSTRERVFVPCGQFDEKVACVCRQLQIATSIFDSLAGSKVSRDLLAAGDHPRQVKLRAILDMIDREDHSLAWIGIIELMGGIKYKQVHGFLEGIVNSSHAALEGDVRDLHLSPFNNWLDD